MRVLMVSPHPVYSPRGTPISVLNRCRALAELGHEVDLVTYPMGESVPVPGLRYLRAGVPGIKTVAVGLSWRKVPLDMAVFAKASWLLVMHRRRYQVLHTHEEAGVLGLLARASTCPTCTTWATSFPWWPGTTGWGTGTPSPGWRPGPSGALSAARTWS